MENASNALMIAGGVLIGILLLSVMVISFNGAADLAKSYDSSAQETSIQAFNNNFEKYKLDEVDIQTIITMTHFAKDYNTKNELTDKDSIYISVICDNTQLEKLTNEKLIEYMEENTFYIQSVDKDGKKIYEKDEDGNIINKKYECNSIEYNENTGMVKKITFKKINI